MNWIRFAYQNAFKPGSLRLVAIGFARLAVGTLATLLVFTVFGKAELKQTKRVLIVNDLGIISSPGFAEVDQAIFSRLEKSPYQIELYHESLEITLFPDQLSQERFRDEFVRKYSERRPDVIIAVGAASFKFLSESQEKFLQETPLVFCALLGEIPDEAKTNKLFTGVVGHLHPAETLDVALKLMPGTKNVVVTGGVGQFDGGFEAIARQGFHDYESKLAFTYLFGLPMPELLERLKHLPKDSIVYHTAITQDSAGTMFIDSAQSVPLVAGASSAPVFVMDDIDLRGGTVGGDLVNWADDGRAAASMALRILSGEKPDHIPIVTSNNSYMFDWNALQRWGLTKAAIPSGSIVLNRPPSFWQLYKRPILTGASVLLAQTLVICALLWQISRRRRSEAALRESEERFRLVANTAPVMIWMAAPDKLCTYFNQPWLEFTGRQIEAELGNGWAQGVHPEDVSACWSTYTDAFDRRESFEMQYRLRRFDGEYRWVYDIGVPRFRTDTSFSGYIGSCIDITERRTAEEALAALSGRLIDAQEEERKRIAREIHDDYNQRLAILANDLEVLTSSLSDSPQKLSQRIRDLWNQVNELGNDLHSMSHRLHSSALENLGLIAGVRSFCEEVATHQAIEVHFSHQNVLPSTPEDVALCLFRIVQEGLRNIKRHSGASKAEVRLEGLYGQLHLTISDAGKGFDVKRRSPESGIGIRSMEERLRSLGGKLEIHSRLGEGTRIDAWVPVPAESERAS
jgi:PAS domain S-box-containing protein